MKKYKRPLVFLLAVLLFVLPMSAFAASFTLSVSSRSYEEGGVVQLSWDAVSGAGTYAVNVSKYPYGSDHLVVEDVAYTNSYAIGGLPAGKYRANVQPIQNGRAGGFSNTVYFTIGASSASSSVSSSAEFVSVMDSEAPTFLWPVKVDESYEGSSFAITAMDIYYDGGDHGRLQNALDINHDGMTTRYETREIVAAAAGEVIDVHDCGHNALYCPSRSCEGSYIKIRHEIPDENGEIQVYITAYVHLDPDTFEVQEGDYVEQGQTIARMGSTGNSSGIHLHFAIRDENNQDLPTLEFYMNETYMPLLEFKYFRQSGGELVATNGEHSRYSEWVGENYTYSDGRWVYAN